MPFGTPYTEAERASRHLAKYGEAPPLVRGLRGPKGETIGEDVWDALPALPFEFGVMTLPLPRKMMREANRR